MSKATSVVETLSAEPVKGFFVDMLTRDIHLEDAILDLLDNCVDGVVRGVGKPALQKKKMPYEGYFAEITSSATKFTIKDNCGGIPDDRRAYAFRMGSPPKGTDLHLPTVGTYGIGMKRAMFKLGKNCLVETKTDTDEYAVEFSKSWFNDENQWRIPITRVDTGLKETGTRVTVTSIRDGVKDQIGHAGFLLRLKEQIATHYALILAKGFSVTINGEKILGKPILLRFSNDEKGIRPFIFRTEVKGVSVFAVVGFTVPIPSELEANVTCPQSLYHFL